MTPYIEHFFMSIAHLNVLFGEMSILSEGENGDIHNSVNNKKKKKEQKAG